MPWLSFLRRALAGLLVIALLGVLGIVVVNLLVIRAGRPYRIGNLEQVSHATVAIVLGAQVYNDGTCSPMLADRLQTAVELYQLGAVNRLLLSGDHGQRHYDEVNAMKNYVLARGVPAQAIFLDHAGFSTYETMFRARDVFQVKDAIVVTQSFHLDRALATARALGLDARGAEAPCSGYVPKRSLLAREWLARCKAWLELNITHPAPTYLGEAIPISGEAAKSWD